VRSANVWQPSRRARSGKGSAMGDTIHQIAPDWKPHESHKMGKAVATVWAPCGTPRFYSVRTCKLCGGEVGHHSAGHFATPEMFKKCRGSNKELFEE
jgi:hypothetical protein